MDHPAGEFVALHPFRPADLQTADSEEGGRGAIGLGGGCRAVLAAVDFLSILKPQNRDVLGEEVLDQAGEEEHVLVLWTLL